MLGALKPGGPYGPIPACLCMVLGPRMVFTFYKDCKSKRDYMMETLCDLKIGLTDLAYKIQIAQVNSNFRKTRNNLL